MSLPSGWPYRVRKHLITTAYNVIGLHTLYIILSPACVLRSGNKTGITQQRLHINRSLQIGGITKNTAYYHIFSIPS